MRFLGKTLFATLLSVAASAPLLAQGPQPATTVPRLVPVAGVFTPADGRPPAPVETVTLSIYAEESGGSALWEEAQSVTLDASGRYQILLGASLAEGVPLDVFASGEARWLGIRFQRPGEVDTPRARLTSVPYAVHAANADTLGGRPASAYLLAPEAGGRDAGAPVAAAISAAEVSPAAITPGQTNSVAKYLDTADTIGPSAIFASGDNVGIGTGNAISVGPSAPTDRLNVQFSDTGGAITGISVRNTGATAASYSGMLFYDQNGALAQFQGFNNATHEYRINNIASGGSINFMLGGSSKFRVAPNGSVGIGTGSPAAKLDVVHPATQLRFGPSTADNGGYLISTVPSQAVVSGGATWDGVNWIAKDTTASFTAHQSGSIRFYTATSLTAGTPFLPVEHMRIDGNGSVGIGTGFIADRLHVDGEVRVANCVRRADATGIAGTCPSDRQFKREITSFGAALQAVAALRPVHYYWRAAEFPEHHFGDGRTYGLIAQEVEQVLPELVVTHPDGYKAVDYSKLPLLTVQAIKELKAENEALQSRVAALERLVKQLLVDR